MPFLIPVLVGISVLFGGRYVIYIWCIKPRKTRNRDRKPDVRDGGGLLRVGTPYVIPALSPVTPLPNRASVDWNAPHQFARPPPHTRIRSGNSVSAPALPWLVVAAGGPFWPFFGLRFLLP